MQSKEMITILVAVVGCIVGVAGFATGAISRAKKDGELLAQIKFCVKGIDKIEQDISFIKNTNTEMITNNAIQENRITTIEKDVHNLKVRVYKDGS